MQDRLRKFRRIEAVQEQMHRRAEAELLRLERALAAAAEERRAILAAVNGDTYLPFMAGVAARRLRGIETEIARLQAERAAQQARALEQGMRLRRAERLVERYAGEADTAAERAALAEAIENAAGRTRASFPPA